MGVKSPAKSTFLKKLSIPPPTKLEVIFCVFLRPAGLQNSKIIKRDGCKQPHKHPKTKKLLTIAYFSALLLYLQGISAFYRPPPPAPAKSPNPSYPVGVVRWGERWVFWFGFLGFFRAFRGVWWCLFFGFVAWAVRFGFLGRFFLACYRSE